MTPQKKLVALILFLSGLPSCTFSVPQAENVLRQVQSLLSEQGEANEALWLASYNGQGAILKPYTAEGYTVFANESGDAVAFDGWVVRSVLGFGLEKVVTISDDGWVRSSRSEKGSILGTCSEWQKGAATQGYQWRQICGINGHETVISIDETGTISDIKQAFGGDLGTLELNLRR